MKKLFSLISVILCVTMLAMSVSAATAEPAAEENPYKIFKLAAERILKAKTLDYKIVMRENYDTDTPSNNSTVYMRVKLIDSGSDATLRSEVLVWEGKGEYIARFYIKDGVGYDALEMEKNSYIANDLGSREFYQELYYELVGTDLEDYKTDLTNLSVERLKDGRYCLRYTIDGDKYILGLDKNYTPVLVESISETAYNKSAMKTTIAVNGSVSIAYPSDLAIYED